jgi:2,5-diketo-D-gluconate reductase A
VSIRTVPLLPLSDGHSIPQLGVGTASLHDDQLADLIVTAAELGYRHLDTALRYDNEEAVGEGIRRSGLPRDEWFVTTKLDGEHQGGERAVEGLRSSLDRLGLEQVDLLLIHWPLPGRDQYVDTWRTFIHLREEGLVRSIGVSNFLPDHLDRLAAETGVVPVLDQIQLNPEVARPELEDYLRAHDILSEAWSPLGGDGGVLQDPAIGAVADAHGVTPGQAVIAWHLAHGRVVIPRTRNAERLGDNLAALDVELTPAEVAAIDALAVPGAGVDPQVSGH